jgi:hypothetical protein
MDSCLFGSGDKPSIFSSSRGSPFKKCGNDSATGIPENKTIELDEWLGHADKDGVNEAALK